MWNELIFLIHSIIVSLGAVSACFFGKQALTSFVSMCYIMANILITKQILLFGFHATATDAYIIGSSLGMNLLNEFYGKASARAALYISFLMALFFLVLSMVHIAYIPSAIDTYHVHFVALFTPTPRIIIASFVSYFISQTVEYTLYNYLKSHFKDTYFIRRNWATLSISQLIDTVIFSFLGLYGILSNIGSIILVSYSLKLITIILMSPLLILVKKLYHSIEQP
ncbi:MAG: queuosine precursor transporter [Candidatus Babeliales bacterium]